MATAASEQGTNRSFRLLLNRALLLDNGGNGHRRSLGSGLSDKLTANLANHRAAGGRAFHLTMHLQDYATVAKPREQTIFSFIARNGKVPAQASAGKAGRQVQNVDCRNEKQQSVQTHHLSSIGCDRKRSHQGNG